MLEQREPRWSRTWPRPVAQLHGCSHQFQSGLVKRDAHKRVNGFCYEYSQSKYARGSANTIDITPRHNDEDSERSSAWINFRHLKANGDNFVKSNT